MAKYKYIAHQEGDLRSITVYTADGMLPASSTSHANFQQIWDAVLNGEDNALALFDAAKAVEAKFEQVSDRVSMKNGEVFFDGDLVDDRLTQTIKRFAQEGADFMPLVNFFEKVAQNPQAHSREQLYRFVDANGITITDDGDIVLYKGVRKTDDGKFTSISTGTAIVNGVTHTGAIPNAVGDVVDMPRSQVAHDPGVACHTGLHAGTYQYATNFAQGATLTVLVNPRDVVSVPNDHASAKVRTCRYTVLEVNEREYTSAFQSFKSDGDFETVTVDDYGDDLDEDEDDLYDDSEYDDPWYGGSFVY